MGPGCFQVMMAMVGLGCAPSTGSLQENSFSQGQQQCIYSGPVPALPQVSDGALLWLPGVIFGLTRQFVIAKLS